MEINGKSPLVDLGARPDRLDMQEQQSQRCRPAGRPAAQSTPDRIELSVRSRELQQLDALIKAVPDVREARVEEVRRSIESGTYNVRAEQVAEKILGGMLIDQIF